MAFAITLHLLSVVIWVGGMFFAYIALRPVAARLLEPQLRLDLWLQTFQRFFPWVWAATLSLLITGYWMIFAVFGGMAQLRISVHIMMGIGTLMILLFFHLFFAPYRRLKQAMIIGDQPESLRRLGQIRQLIGINLILGLTVITITLTGKYLGF